MRNEWIRLKKKKGYKDYRASPRWPVAFSISPESPAAAANISEARRPQVQGLSPQMPPSVETCWLVKLGALPFESCVGWCLTLYRASPKRGAPDRLIFRYLFHHMSLEEHLMVVCGKGLGKNMLLLLWVLSNSDPTFHTPPTKTKDSSSPGPPTLFRQGVENIFENSPAGLALSLHSPNRYSFDYMGHPSWEEFLLDAAVLIASGFQFDFSTMDLPGNSSSAEVADGRGEPAQDGQAPAETLISGPRPFACLILHLLPSPLPR